MSDATGELRGLLVRVDAALERARPALARCNAISNEIPERDDSDWPAALPFWDASGLNALSRVVLDFYESLSRVESVDWLASA